jgi:hypothetical protein
MIKKFSAMYGIFTVQCQVDKFPHFLLFGTKWSLLQNPPPCGSFLAACNIIIQYNLHINQGKTKYMILERKNSSKQHKIG